ncbi:MAG: hypothetical protein JO345_09450 [Streptosporangiaceae bacterium]|nr:hypothetical protein [Streptosporangiaceae bacterium]
MRQRAVSGRLMSGALMITLLAVAGCGSQSAPVATPATRVSSASLTSSLVTAQGTWAIVDMGGSASDAENFWQLFVRPAGSSKWALATPPGVADNGGLVAAASASSLVIGFRPSQSLVFSPLATTSDTGKAWTPGILSGALANVPDALSIGPSGQGLALLANGSIQASDNVTSGTWTRLTTVAAIGASAAGRSCGLREVGAMSFVVKGVKVVAGSCARRGVAGVFTDTNGMWQANGPALPPGYADDQVRVLRLSGTTALVSAGTSLFAAWYGAGRWTISAPLAGAGQPIASGFGTGGSAWALLSGGRAETISGPGGAWQALPKAPNGTAAIALGTATALQALAVSGGTATIWQLSGASWTKVQMISVPIQSGSSS